MPDVICAFVFQGGQQSLAAPHDPRVQRERGAALQGGDAVETVGFLLLCRLSFGQILRFCFLEKWFKGCCSVQVL